MGISFLRRDLNLPKVGGDQERIGQLAAEYFPGRGYRHFAWAPFIRTEAASERYESYARGLAEKGFVCHQLPPPNVLGDEGSGKDWNRRREELIRRLRKLPKPLAIFAFNDCVAADIVHACEEADIDVPEVIAVLGVDK